MAGVGFRSIQHADVGYIMCWCGFIRHGCGFYHVLVWVNIDGDGYCYVLVSVYSTWLVLVYIYILSCADVGFSNMVGDT
jgi:hypothetical protein